MRPASFPTGLILACLFVNVAEAQSKIQPDNDPTDPTGLWDADVMMEQATINISRRYNLNDEQEAYTRQLLKSRTRAFLAEHEDDLRGMLKELFVRLEHGFDCRNMPSISDWICRGGYGSHLISVTEWNDFSISVTEICKGASHRIMFPLFRRGF